MRSILALDLGRFNQKTHGAIFTDTAGRGNRFTCATNAESLQAMLIQAKAAGVTQVSSDNYGDRLTTTTVAGRRLSATTTRSGSA
jgi:hypothetical protein